MKIIYNSKLARLLLPNFKMILITFILLCKKDKSYYDEEDLEHERTHAYQWTTLCLSSLIMFYILGLMFDNYWLMLISPFTFYIWYLIDWFFRFVYRFVKNPPSFKLGFKNYFKAIGEINHEAYRAIVFEKEAYAVEKGMTSYALFSFLLYY